MSLNLFPRLLGDSEYQWFEIEGRYDPILEAVFDEIVAGTGPQWFWLMYGERGCLCPTLKSFNKQMKTAILTCQEREEPKIVGLDLAYFRPAWQLCHVWMVLDPKWGWERRQFQSSDAIAEDFESQSISIVDGREVKLWTKLERAKGGAGQSHQFPEADEPPTTHSGTRLVPGGWDHEHCELCNAHIDPGDVGYCDPEERWICQNCYERYVARHDLAFVDEL
jgi:hypothetical protein